MLICSRRCGWMDIQRYSSPSLRPARTAQPRRACWKRSTGAPAPMLTVNCVQGQFEGIAGCTVDQLRLRLGIESSSDMLRSHGQD